MYIDRVEDNAYTLYNDLYTHPSITAADPGILEPGSAAPAWYNFLGLEIVFHFILCFCRESRECFCSESRE